MGAGANLDPFTLREKFRRRFLRDLKPEHKAFGEGSVSTLYIPDAYELMLKVFPAARFIVMVREPVNMFHSYHRRLFFCRQESVEDPNQAWALQETRAQGHEIPRTCRDPRLLQYGGIVQLGRWVEQLFQKVGRERCHVVVFDDLVANPGKTYRAALDFLGLADDQRELFPKKNVGRAFHYTWLQDLCFSKLFIPTIPLDAGAELDLSPIRQLTYPIHKAIRTLNTRHGGHSIRLTIEMQSEIRQTCAADIQLLQSLIGRELGAGRSTRRKQPKAPSAGEKVAKIA